MIFGVPLEIRTHEHRVGAVPSVVHELVSLGHEVLVESKAGERSRHSDADYTAAGATIVPSPEKLYSQAEVILKVRGPIPVEYDLIRPDHILFAFFRFFNRPEKTLALLGRGCTCYAYEMFKTRDNRRPLLDVDCRIAGQVAVQQGSAYLMTQHGGRGVLLGRIPFGDPLNVTILGLSVSGISAAAYAAQNGARICIVDPDETRFADAASRLPDDVKLLKFLPETLQEILPATDLLISTMQEVEDLSPVVLSKAEVGLMPAGSVLVDLAMDFGGSVETGNPTSPDNPTFVVDGVIHYCVRSLPSMVAATASEALSNALLPYLIRFCEGGFVETLKADGELASGLAFFEGWVTHEKLAETLGVKYVDFRENGE